MLIKTFFLQVNLNLHSNVSPIKKHLYYITIEYVMYVYIVKGNYKRIFKTQVDKIFLYLDAQIIN